MTKREGRQARLGAKPVDPLVRRTRAFDPLVRRTRAFGDDDKAARESQRRASAYGRARGNP